MQVGAFFVDFLCRRRKLVVEIDALIGELARAPEDVSHAITQRALRAETQPGAIT